MKQIIMDVLDDMSESQINLASETARKTVSSLISAALKAQGYNNKNNVNSYLTADLSEEEQKARETWVCYYCGENTYDVDYEYIGSCTNHLGCELEVETREKNWSQKKHEDKVFNQAVFGDNKDLYEAKLDNRSDNHREYPYNSFVRNKEEVDKLAEEIVSDNDTGYIYESPDGGKTVYKRKEGSDKRELVKDWKKINVRT